VKKIILKNIVSIIVIFIISLSAIFSQTQSFESSRYCVNIGLFNLIEEHCTYKYNNIYLYNDSSIELYTNKIIVLSLYKRNNTLESNKSVYDVLNISSINTDWSSAELNIIYNDFLKTNIDYVHLQVYDIEFSNYINIYFLKY